MGFSTSGATAIIFIGLLVAVGVAYPALEGAADRRASAIADRDERALDVRNTQVDAVNASYNATTDVLSLEVQNTGSTTLTVSETDLLIDGEYRTGYETAVEAVDRDLWQPGEVLVMTVTGVEDPDRAKVVTEYGVAETVTGVADGG